MKQKNKKVIYLSGLLIALLIPVYTIFAASDITKILKDEIFKRDFFAYAQDVNNQGTIKGDMITVSRNTSSSGKIEGDLLSASFDIASDGIIEGNTRLIGANINIAGSVGKNANLLSNIVRIDKTAEIGGNLLAYANDIEVAGKVKGYSRITGSNIVLSGEFFGDVEINTELGYGSPDVLLHILPDTKIHGKLIYKGINEALIEEGSQIKSFEWVKALDKNAGETKREIFYHLSDFQKTLVSAIIYFFIAMLIYRLFPGLFTSQGTIIRQKTLTVIGVGLAAMALIIAAVITFIFLLAVTVLIAKPGSAFIFAAIMGLVYIILFYFSAIPVSMYLGNIILKNKYNLPVRLGTGLLTITFTTFMLNYLGELHSIGIIFSALKIILTFGICIVGTGSILYSFGNAFKKLRNL